MRPASFLLVALTFAGTVLAQATTGLYRLSSLTGGLPIGDGGPALSARLNLPEGVAIDTAGNIYLSDTEGHRIRRIAPGSNTISTLAGRGRGNAGDGGPALQASFNSPTRLLLDGSSFLYVVDSGNRRIRRINLTSGIVEGFAGNGRRGFAGDGGPARDAQFGGFINMAFDPRYFYIADSANDRVRRIDRQTNIITTFAGIGSAGFSGDNGVAGRAQLNTPTAVQVLPNGTVIFMDNGNSRLRQVEPNALTISTIAVGFEDFNVTDLRLDPTNTLLYLNDLVDDSIFRFNLQTRALNRVAGVIGSYGLFGDNGPATQATLNSPAQLALDPSGNQLYFADRDNHRIRRVDLAGTRVITVAGSPAYGGDQTSVSGSILFNPTGIAADSRGNLYISENGNCIIRRVDSATLLMTRFAGQVNLCKSNPRDGVDARTSTLSYPFGLVFDTADNLYVADAGNGRVRRITPQGIISTVASGLASPRGLAIDQRSRTLYIAEAGRNRVVALDLNSTTNYALYAGNGNCNYSGDGGQAGRAELCYPTGITVASNGALLIADSDNSVIRRVDPVTKIITTIAGTGQALVGSNFTSATETDIAFPWDLDLDASGNLYISSLNRILRVTPGGQVAVVAGPVNNDEGYQDAELATNGRLNFATNVRVAANGNVYFADALNHFIRQMTPYRASRAEIVAGNQQTVGLGLSSSPLTVRVTAEGGRLAPNVDVEWAVTAGGATLASRLTPTDPDGLARVIVRMPTAAAPVVVTATVSGLPVLTFTLTAQAGAGGGGGGPVLGRPVIQTAVSAGAFGGSTRITSGGWMEIFGQNLSATTRSWEGPDFDGVRAPTVLDGVRVAVDGRSAFVAYISPAQINLQVPDGIGTGNVQVIVSNGFGTSVAFSVTSASRVPGLLAPAAFRASNRQYVGALFADGTFVGPPDLVPGAPFRRAAPGDSIVFYAVGCGATNPVFPSGVVVADPAPLPNVVMRFGDHIGRIAFAGLAPGLVGLYQFNVVVPDGVTGDTALTLSVDGVASAQSLFFAAR